eukprot:SAG11_NODE_34340_length_272_cov_1.080925_1_plen_59_part_10
MYTGCNEIVVIFFITVDDKDDKDDSCEFQNWSQKFLGFSIDAFFCPERLAEILWETWKP